MWKFLSPLGDLLSGVVKAWSDHALTKAQGQIDITKAEINAEVVRTTAEATRAQAAQDGEQQWDMEAARQAQHSWKDELWTIVAAFPIVLAFIPGGAAIVAIGFNALSTVPSWYQAVVAASVAFAFGIRHIVNIIKDKWN